MISMQSVVLLECVASLFVHEMTVTGMHFRLNFLCLPMCGWISVEHPISWFFYAPWLFDEVATIYFHLWTLVGDITSRLSTDTTLMARAVALNVNVLLRTLIKTVGMLSLMMSLSWKLTLLMIMETPITGLLQSVHDNYYLVWYTVSRT